MTSYLDAIRLSRARAQEPASPTQSKHAEQEPPSTASAPALEPSSPQASPKNIAARKVSSPKAFQSAKLDLDKAQGLNETRFAADKVRSWQQSGDGSASPSEDSPKQPRTKTLVASRARAKTLASPGALPERANDKKGDSMPDQQGSVNVTGVVVEVRASTSPKRRIVSDEHWLNNRPSAQPIQTTMSKHKASEEVGETTLVVRPGSKRADAWVRRKSTPKKGKAEAQRDTEQTTPHPAVVEPPISNEVEKGKLPLTKGLSISAPATPTAKQAPGATDKGHGDGIAAAANVPDVTNEKVVTPKKDASKRIMQVRKRPPKPTVTQKPVGEEDSSMPEPMPVQNKLGSRMQAWLSQTPDPFVDGQKIPEAEYDGVEQRENNNSPRHRNERHHRMSPIQSDSEDRSSLSSSTLRRSGARRGANSPVNKGRWFSEGVHPTTGTKVEKQNAHTIRKNERQNLGDIDGNINGGKPRQGFRNTISRSLTSHADLISVLSQPHGVKGLVSARAIRTNRKNIEETTLTDIADELRSDESKYLRELRTLVDGVIPVLLNSVLQQSKAGTTGDLVEGLSEVAITKDTIVDLGIVLERILNMHKRIPIYDLDGFVSWAERAYTIYQNYIDVWKLGFQDLVVNLAPGEAEKAVALWNRSSENQDIDMKGDGERVDVSFLLKRPLVRIKYLTKTLKALDHVRPSKQTANWTTKFQTLMDEARWKQDKEHARLEDVAAARVDMTKTRDPETLAPSRSVQLKKNRCVRARDLFDLKLFHTSGQRLDCHVMLILRDDISGAGSGDVLICEVESASRWLLLPPIELQQISARHGNQNREMVVMIRGLAQNGREWRELLSLVANNPDTAADWIDMLGSNPLPPSINSSYSFKKDLNDRLDRHGQLSLYLSPGGRGPNWSEVDVPLGEQSVLSSLSDELRSQPPGNGRDFSEAHNKSTYADPNTRHVQEAIDPKNLVMGESKVRHWLSIGQNDHQSPVAVEETAGGANDYSRMNEYRYGPSQRVPLPRRLSTVPSEGLLSSSNAREGAGLTPRSMPTTPNNTGGQSKPQTGVYSLPNARVRESSGLRFSPSNNPHIRRRSSSPLKYEYAPSSISGGSSIGGRLHSEDGGSVTSESSIEDMVADPKLPLSAIARSRKLHPQTDKDMPKGYETTIPHGLHQSLPEHGEGQPNEPRRVIASIFSWSEKGEWELLHPDECSIVVSPGLIEAFKMSAAHSKAQDGKSRSQDYRARKDQRPLIALELTPLVPLRQGTAIDISIRSPPTPNSQIRTGSNIMFRSRTGPECEFLYSLINQARINNPTYIALQNARAPVGSGGWASFMNRQASSRGGRSWWRLGSRKNTYRATDTRRSASLAETISSVATKSSAISALKRFTAGSKMFDLDKSTISSRGGLSDSRSHGSYESRSRPTTPGDQQHNSKGMPAGITDMKIRLYERETASKWRDMGSARLTIMHPPGPSEGVILPSGHLQREKRVVIVGNTRGETLLDVTLGETSFERVARTGIAVKVWEELDQTAKTGGVLAARVRVYMIQMKSEAEAAYTFSLVGRLRY